jgi:cytidylate kinase
MLHLVILRGAPGAGKTKVGSRFADRYGWEFVEVDGVKRERHGTALVSNLQDFSEAGRRAKEALDAGTRVVAEEFFNQKSCLDHFLEPIGFNTESPQLVAIWLDCDVEIAVRRKTDLDEQIVRVAHSVAARRHPLPREIVLDTTSATVEQIVDRVAEALSPREKPSGMMGPARGGVARERDVATRSPKIGVHAPAGSVRVPPMSERAPLCEEAPLRVRRGARWGRLSTPAWRREKPTRLQREQAGIPPGTTLAASADPRRLPGAHERCSATNSATERA